VFNEKLIIVKSAINSLIRGLVLGPTYNVMEEREATVNNYSYKKITGKIRNQSSWFDFKL
jgi:hypothetical protein